MRENALRTGSSYQERGDNRNNPQKSRQASGPRSKRSVNLGRLGAELGLDVLGASLGLSEQALKILVDGRDHIREAHYAAHLSHRLEELGIPSSWLERPYAAILPEYLRSLKNNAAKSRNKAPIRRVNLARLTKAFDGRTDVLADALEWVSASVTNVAEGRLDSTSLTKLWPDSKPFCLSREGITP